MRAQFALGLVLFMVAFEIGHGNIVSLNEALKQYIDNLNDHNGGIITSWSMQRNYSYWTWNRRTGSGHPVEGKVQNLHCVKTGNEAKLWGGRDTYCNEFAAWEITDGIEGPVELYVRVTIPMIRSEAPAYYPRQVWLYLNNKTYIEEEISLTEYKKGRNHDVTIFQNTCEFEAKVTFTGEFVFHELTDYQDEYTFENGVFVPKKIGKLHDSKKGLKETSRGDLTYMIRGKYTQQLCRYGRL